LDLLLALLPARDYETSPTLPQNLTPDIGEIDIRVV
jgi:hypothetical protein